VEVGVATILVVEDAEEMRQLLRDFLGRLNYEVVEATDGLEGIKMAQALRPDLIVLDLMMPVAAGDLTLGFLRSTESLKKIPVIVTSAHPNARNIASKLGANACLDKPFHMNDLKDLIAELVAKPTN
jgi:two-component system, cell cycle response regulator DivK